jgi:CO/xanthine dehydrogenase FAD-binding subunit
MPPAIRRVDSVRKAAAALAAEPGARFLGGGTLLVREVNAGDVSIESLVLSDGLGLDGIEISANRATIGGAATMAKIVAHPKLAFLRPVAESIGGPAVRNMATVGGNLFAPYPYGDFAVALLALGAAVTIEGADKSETVDLEAFLKTRGDRHPAVVAGVSFELPPTGAFRFVKAIRRKPHGASVLSIAAVLPMAGRKVSGARVAYGAMAETAMRARAVEAALEGKALDGAAIEAAVKVAGDGCKPWSDPQASAWYRMNVLPVHLKRLLSAEAA